MTCTVRPGSDSPGRAADASKANAGSGPDKPHQKEHTEMSANTHKVATPTAKPAQAAKVAEKEADKTEQVAESPNRYKPETDSTPAFAAKAKEKGRLFIEITGGSCPCGCGGQAKARFLPGHDAKLKGKLARAAVADVGITLVDGEEEQDATPKQFAEALSKASKHDWVAALDLAVERAKAQAVETEARRKAAAIKKAERAAAGTGGQKKLSISDFKELVSA